MEKRSLLVFLLIFLQLAVNGQELFTKCIQVCGPMGSFKTLNDLINEVYEIVGKFSFERNDLHLKEETKQRILVNCREGNYKSFGKYKVFRVEDMDGYKYFFENGDWLMIRASGTEPVLRTYAESDSKAAAFDILDEAKKVLLS